MKQIAMAILGSFVLVLCSLGFTTAADMTYTGEIMDSQCAKMGSHQQMIKTEFIVAQNLERQCTLNCVKGGAKFVLFDPTTKTVYQLDDQQKPMQFAGEKVKVVGTLDKATKTIHVTDIQGAS